MNTHKNLDELRWRLSVEVARTHTPVAIREKARANLARWREQGTWGAAYDEWSEILSGSDAELLAVMTARDERSDRLRQSMPYIGMLSGEQREACRKVAMGNARSAVDELAMEDGNVEIEFEPFRFAEAQLGEVMAQAIDALGTEEAAADWLLAEHESFGTAPLAALQDEGGVAAVRAVLNAIATGGPV